MKTLRAMFAVILLIALPPTVRANGRLVLSVVDQQSGKPIAARMHLKNVQGKVIRPPGSVNWSDHFVFFDKIALKLPNGGYEFVIERGPEYHDVTGHFNIEAFADDTKTVELRRFVDMAKEGWFSGDLDVRRPENDLKLLMQADDVHVVPLVTWSAKSNPWSKRPAPKELVTQFDGSLFYNLLGGDLSTPGNPLRVLRLDKPPALLDSAAFQSGAADGLGCLPLLPWIEQMRREQHAWVDAGAMFARDLPIWIAAGVVDSIELAGPQLERNAVARDEAGVWPRDKSKYPDPYGPGLWSQTVYYHLLNCGLRIPPTAGSGSGDNTNPVGYNRVYVHVAPVARDVTPSSGAQPSITWNDWWNALRAGRVTVTNGPLLRPLVEGQLPGHVFQSEAEKPLELLIGLTLSTRDKIRYLEIVKDGRPEQEINLDQWKASGGKLPPLKFTHSGWFLIRAVCENPKTYRFATTAPYYVQIGYQPRISRTSAQFFLDWTNRRAAEVAAAAGAADSAAAQAAQQYLERAQEFWRTIVDKASTD